VTGWGRLSRLDPAGRLAKFSRVRILPSIFLLLAFIGIPVLRGQTSDEEKRRLFLEAREDIRPVPKASASPRPKPQSSPRPKPKPTAEPDETPRPKPKPSAEPEETPRPKPKPSAEPDETPRPKPKPSAEPDETPRPKTTGEQDFILLPGEVPSQGVKPAVSATPASQTTPLPTASPVQIPQGTTPAGHPLDAPIHVEKSGMESEQGDEPAPKPLLGGFFKRYRYLTPGVRRAIDEARVRRGRWKYIIIHNSGTRQGNARIFDVYHRRVRKMQNGLAYHFVIGNGNSSGNGEIEIGNRWKRQINGGHVASDYLNDIAIGICLVGDLNRDQPTKEQLEAIDELVTYLRGRVGKIKGRQSIVKGHKEINPKPTDCPGDRFPLGWLHRKFR
jgi:hypothetical protein